MSHVFKGEREKIIKPEEVIIGSSKLEVQRKSEEFHCNKIEKGKKINEQAMDMHNNTSITTISEQSVRKFQV